MLMTADQSQAQTATLVDLGAIFVSLGLSKSTWLVTDLSPCSEKVSRHSIIGGDIAGPLAQRENLWRRQLQPGPLGPCVHLRLPKPVA
ncbi:hypothetical protein J2857_004898 [Neorhizobium galegae]|nr:hypothetical protein [Neorhizobium galegae]MBP2562107.1 hypothetical protein [Neorhizobium galegae]